VASNQELQLDHDRFARTGVAEAVYAPGKSPAQCAAAVAGLLSRVATGPVLLTRASAPQVEAALARNPGATATPVGEDAHGRPLRTLAWRALAPAPGSVLLLTAGTADLPVAREAEAVLAAYGHATTLVADVGVAGLHRVLAQQARLAEARVVIVAAGMEGALASVVTGLTDAPVIAVPTSTGYGATFGGVSALLAMITSCAAGVAVVNIDDGFGAGTIAARIARQSA